MNVNWLHLPGDHNAESLNVMKPRWKEDGEGKWRKAQKKKGGFERVNEGSCSLPRENT